MVKDFDDEIFQLHCQVCKSLANPVRLKIMYCLGENELPVSAIIKMVGVRKANLSQHLAILRQVGIVRARRKGLNVYYSIADPKIIRACNILREVLYKQLKEKANLVNKRRQYVVG